MVRNLNENKLRTATKNDYYAYDMQDLPDGSKPLIYDSNNGNFTIIVSGDYDEPDKYDLYISGSEDDINYEDRYFDNKKDCLAVANKLISMIESTDEDIISFEKLTKKYLFE